MSPSTRLSRSVLVGLGALVIPSVVACGAADTAQWKVFAPDGGEFAVSVPREPTTDRHVSNGQAGSFDSTIYTIALDGGGFFTIVVGRLPDRVDTKGGAPVVLDSACDQVVDSAAATQSSRQTIYLSGVEGRKIEGTVADSTIPGGADLRARIYVAKGRLYQLVAIMPKDDRHAAAADRFFDSFEIRDA